MTVEITQSTLEARLDYTFTRKDLLAEALTHASSGPLNYERLEFLGDRVLGMVVGNWLWETYLEAQEGELSRRHTTMVRESSLVSVAEAWGLRDFIRYGGGEVHKDSILADVVEAILGAVWLDGGFENVDALVRKEWGYLLDIKDEKDAKSRLQEWLQGAGMELPSYEVIEESGPDHDKHFKVQVNTAKGACVGEGRSKHVASLNAAINMMKNLEK